MYNRIAGVAGQRGNPCYHSRFSEVIIMTGYSGDYRGTPSGGTWRKEDILTIKNLIRLLAGLCLLFFFAPMYKITIAGVASRSISGWNGLMGVTMNDVKVLDGNPVYLLPLLLPAAILAVTFLGRQLTDRIVLIIISICSGLDILFWIILFFHCAGKVKEYTETSSPYGNSFENPFNLYFDNYLQIKLDITAWYILTILFLIAILTLSILCTLGKLRLNGLIPSGYRGGSHEKWEPAETQRVRFCPACGNRIDHSGKFCGRCGNPLK